MASEPSTYQPKSACKACTSPRGDEINWRLRAGEPTRTISKWLATHGESISHPALLRHKGSHLDLPPAQPVNLETADVAIGVVRAKEQLDGARVLEKVARLAWGHAKKFKDAAPASKEDVALLGMLLRETRGAVMDRHELLNGKRKTVTVEPVNPSDEKELDELEQEVFGGKRQGTAGAENVATTLLPPVSTPLDS